MASRVASWFHGSIVSVIFTPMRWRRSSRPFSVILGKRSADMVFSPGVSVTGCVCKCRRRFAVAQDFAVYLARGCLGQLTHKFNVAREFVLAEPLPREILQFVD